MISLEMLGYYDHRPAGSQHYPPLFRWFYPDRGDFLGLLQKNFRSINTPTAPLPVRYPG